MRYSTLRKLICNPKLRVVRCAQWQGYFSEAEMGKQEPHAAQQEQLSGGKKKKANVVPGLH